MSLSPSKPFLPLRNTQTATSIKIARTGTKARQAGPRRDTCAGRKSESMVLVHRKKGRRRSKVFSSLFLSLSRGLFCSTQRPIDGDRRVETACGFVIVRLRRAKDAVRERKKRKVFYFRLYASTAAPRNLDLETKIIKIGISSFAVYNFVGEDGFKCAVVRTVMGATAVLAEKRKERRGLITIRLLSVLAAKMPLSIKEGQ